MVTVYVITYNEEIMIEFFINHYRKRFPNCEINIYDNKSTDNTIKIAKDNNCNVIEYDTNGTLSDSTYLKIKNNCWKESKTDWVIVCDCDELIDINYDNLIKESDKSVNIIKPEGYSLMNCGDGINLKEMYYGFRDFGFDKCILFNKNQIENINFSVGAHTCNPTPKPNHNVKFSEDRYKLLHYKYLNQNYSIIRHKMFGDRLSNENKLKGWGVHYNYSPESIIEFYKQKEKELIKIL